MKDTKIFLPKSELPQLLAVVTVIWVLSIATCLGWAVFQSRNVVAADICVLLAGLCATGFAALRMKRSESKRAKAEELLREKEAAFSVIATTSSEAIVMMSHEGEIAYWNNAAERMFGYSAEEVAGKDLHLLLGPERDHAVFRDGFSEFRVSGTGPSIGNTVELVAVHKSGREFPVELSISAVRIKGDFHALGIIHDITDRKKAEEEMLRLHRWNQLILNAAGEGIVGLDLAGKVIFANPTAAEIIGQKPDELIGDTIYHLVQHSRQRLPNPGENQTSGEIPGKTDEVFKRKDGTTVPVSFTNTPIVENGQVRGTVITLRDLTESKKIEEAKAKLEAQLHQALKMEAIGTLAGGIAHDFNNILAVIIGYSEIMLADVQDTGPSRKHLNEVLKAGLRARDLVKQILVFSRMRAGMSMGPIELAPVVNESVKFMRASLPATIEIRQNIEDEGGTTMADATQVHQLIVNLCTNAFHAMEETGGVLEVTLSSIDFQSSDMMRHPKIKPGPYLELMVTDTGHGMDAATINRIFDPYFTTKGPGKGSGLGLAVVHGIVDRHEAVIEVQSQPKKGTSFHVFFPKILGRAARQEDHPEVSSLPGGNERILLVDDEEALADVGQKTLRGLGYEVTVKSNSVEALEIFRENPDSFDLVITDYTMPKMTGAELALEIIRIRPDIGIFLCTGYTERLSQEQAKEIGISEFLMKPLNRREMAHAVRRVLDQKKKSTEEAQGT
jgi:PAS domain S-box-containing protein